MDPAYIIALDRASAAEREAVHAAVKEHATGWWHHFANMWVVGARSTTPAEWRDIVAEALEVLQAATEVEHSNAAVLVMNLPEFKQRDWAYCGPKAESRMEWFHKYM